MQGVGLSVSVSETVKVMLALAVVHAVVREKEKRASSITVLDVFHVLLGSTFMSNFRTKKTKI